MTPRPSGETRAANRAGKSSRVGYHFRFEPQMTISQVSLVGRGPIKSAI
jgi:hypothetical protein